MSINSPPERIVLGSSKTTKTPSLLSTTSSHHSKEFQTNETGLRKRKMKRVRISPKEGHVHTKARGGSRFSSQELQERSLLLDSNDEDNDDRDSVLDQAETRAVLNRARLRARSSSTDSSITSSSSPSINFDQIRQSFRRSSRTISNLTSSDLQYLSRDSDEKVKGPRVETRMRLDHRARKVAGDRVDAVMKAPPNMKKGGLVVIRSYCRY